MMDAALASLRDRILAATAHGNPLRLRGAGTKDFYGEALVGEILDTRHYTGIISYEPSELFIRARCGTKLSDIESALAAHGQFLPFEPPRFGGEPTIGGVIAAGLSGPRRLGVGAARDFVLGASLLDARGELLHFGGQVMKNVAGFDVSRLLCGSLGVLGLITEVSLKVLPRPRMQTTLCFELRAAQALDRFNRWRAEPLPISATAWHGDKAWVQLSGAGSAVRAAQDGLGADALDESQADNFWLSLRDQTHDYFNARTDHRLWRLSLPATTPIETFDADLIEWSGALRWLRSAAPAIDIRQQAARLGGSAMIWSGARDATMFHPLAAINLELHRRLKREFDPGDIFNRGRLFAAESSPEDASRTA